MELIYKVNDRPGFWKTLVFAFQQLLAIVSATIAVPMIVGNGLQPSAALFGAGVATIVYLIITKFKSPVFFGSSFAFIGSMSAAFAGAVSMQVGYLGIIIGSCMAGLIGILAGVLVKCFGTGWIYKLLPTVVIGPVVTIIGLSLAGTAVNDIWAAAPTASPWVCFAIGIFTLISTVIVAHYGKKMAKLVPFAIGIGIGYVASLICTGFGYWFNLDMLKIIDLTPFTNLQWYPNFAFLTAFDGFKDITWGYIGTVALAFIPVSVVTLTEHIADHHNLSTIIGQDLLKEPGLHRTLIGDGLADAVGAMLGGCSTTSYGESVSCVALTKNASIWSIFVAALMAVAVSFIGPVSALLSTIPSCVLNAVCFLLYGFIAVSGLKMIKKVNLEENRNVFIISVILIAGVGGLTLNFGKFTITTVACALILGVILNLILKERNQERKVDVEIEDLDDKKIEEVSPDSTNNLAKEVEMLRLEFEIKLMEKEFISIKGSLDELENYDNLKLEEKYDLIQANLELAQLEKEIKTLEVTEFVKEDLPQTLVAKKYTREQLLAIEMLLTGKTSPRSSNKTQIANNIIEATTTNKLWKMTNNTLAQILDVLNIERPRNETKEFLVEAILSELYPEK